MLQGRQGSYRNLKKKFHDLPKQNFGGPVLSVYISLSEMTAN